MGCKKRQENELIYCGFTVEIVNTTIGRVCDFEEHECGFVSAGDTDFVSWVRTSRMLMPGGDMQLLELTPSQDSTYHTIAGASLLDFTYNLRTSFVEENNAVMTLCFYHFV